MCALGPAGAGLSYTRYASGEFPVVGLEVEYLFTRASISGDELLPVGTSLSGPSHTLSFRLSFGTRQAVQ